MAPIRKLHQEEDQIDADNESLGQVDCVIRDDHASGCTDRAPDTRPVILAASVQTRQNFTRTKWRRSFPDNPTGSIFYLRALLHVRVRQFHVRHSAVSI